QGTVEDFAVARFNPNGSLDTTFGPKGSGLVITDVGGGGFTEAWAVVLQSDGKIIAAGDRYGSNEDFALVRYNANGTLDTSFGTGGIVTTDLQSGSNDEIHGLSLETVVDAGGHSSTKIVAVGYVTGPRFPLARYNLDGTLDPAFGSGGKVITD